MTVPCVLFHAPPDQVARPAGNNWKRLRSTGAGKALVFCDCVVDPGIRQRFRARAASTAVARQFGIPGGIIVEADREASGRNDPALRTVQSIARELRMKVFAITPGSENLFEAAMTLGSAALTPLIDGAATLLRGAGFGISRRRNSPLRCSNGLRAITLVPENRAGSGISEEPVAGSLDAQIIAAGPRLEPYCANWSGSSLESFGKHTEVAAEPDTERD